MPGTGPVDRKVYVVDTIRPRLRTRRHPEPDASTTSSCIPFPVLQELDRRRTDTNGVGYTARNTIRFLDQLQGEASLDQLQQGIPLNGGVLQFHGGAHRIDPRVGRLQRGLRRRRDHPARQRITSGRTPTSTSCW